MRYLVVKDFSNLQHYKGRTPPWIKLHRDVVSKYEFSCLQDASKAHLVLIWLLASSHDNRIPMDAEWIARRIEARSPINLPELVSSGLIEVWDDASGVLARCEQNACLEERRGEGEGEKKKTPPKKDSAGIPFDFAPFAEAWFAQYGGQISADPNAATLKALCKVHGAEEVLRRWVIYLAGTGSQYATASKLKSGWGEYAAVSQKTATNGAPSRGRILLDIFREFDLTTYSGDAAGYEAKITAAKAHPLAGPRLRAEIKIIQPWKPIDGANDFFKAREIDTRLAAATGGT